MLNMLHKGENATVNNVEPNEGERTLLCSNRSSNRSPSLDLERFENASQDELIGILADILLDAFLWEHEHRNE
jgi:hypothetical protein